MTPARLAEIRGRQLHAGIWSERSRHPYDHSAINDLLLALDAATAERDAALAERDASLARLEARINDYNNVVAALNVADARSDAAEQESSSWRERYLDKKRDFEKQALSWTRDQQERDAEIARLRALTTWQPIETCPREVTRALLYWPAFKLDEDGNLTTEPASEGLVSLSYRTVGGGWEELDPTLEATGEYFGDDWEYGEPTHWQPLPVPPATTDEKRG